MALNVEGLKNIPLGQRVILVVLVLVILVGGFVYLVYIPKNNEIHRLTQEIEDLDREIAKNQAKVRRLDQLKMEYAVLQEKLRRQMEQLPPEAEVPELLKQVSDLGTRMGLEILLWRPVGERISPSGLYKEIPVDVEVRGGYHSVALFFDRISKLRRIVNVQDIRMGGPKLERNRVVVNTKFRAVAFALIEEQPAQSASAGKPEVRSKG